MTVARKYNRAQIVIHWASALLIAGMAIGGLAYSYDWLDNSVIVYHQIGGQILILLIVARIGFKLARPASWGHDKSHAAWERWLAGGVHIALYACLIAFAFTGYVSASAISDNVLLLPADLAWSRSDTGEMLLEWHYRLKWVLLGLFGLHFAGAMKHALVDRDHTLSHIIPSRK